jgi:hypothetical protein
MPFVPSAAEATLGGCRKNVGVVARQGFVFRAHGRNGTALKACMLAPTSALRAPRSSEDSEMNVTGWLAPSTEGP